MDRKLRDPLLAGSLLLLLALLLMAYRAEWQYDEAWTYMGIANSSCKDIVTYTSFNLANNHVFNSLYFHWLQGMGAKAEIIYRIVSLLSYIVYCLFLYRLLEQQNPGGRSRSSVVLLLLPYMGFFALGRGYAPALAGFTAACWMRPSPTVPSQQWLDCAAATAARHGSRQSSGQ